MRLGHDAAVFAVHGDLRVERVREQAALRVVEREAGFVTGAFDAENEHGYGQGTPYRARRRKVNVTGKYSRRGPAPLAAARAGCRAGTIRAMETYDIAVIGAGAAGMMSAAVAGQLGRRVVLIDHAPRLAEKIRISGGGRCNFTNLYAGPDNYLSSNPHFARSALARYTPRDFLGLLKRHHVTWHEKHKGQLFATTAATRSSTC